LPSGGPSDGELPHLWIWARIPGALWISAGAAGARPGPLERREGTIHPAGHGISGPLAVDPAPSAGMGWRGGAGSGRGGGRQWGGGQQWEWGGEQRAPGNGSGPAGGADGP